MSELCSIPNGWWSISMGTVLRQKRARARGKERQSNLLVLQCHSISPHTLKIELWNIIACHNVRHLPSRFIKAHASLDCKWIGMCVCETMQSSAATVCLCTLAWGAYTVRRATYFCGKTKRTQKLVFASQMQMTKWSAKECKAFSLCQLHELRSMLAAGNWRRWWWRVSWKCRTCSLLHLNIFVSFRFQSVKFWFYSWQTVERIYK